MALPNKPTMRKEFRLSDLPDAIKRRISMQGGKSDRRESIRTAAEYNRGFISSPTLGDLYIHGSVFFVLSHGNFPTIQVSTIPDAQQYVFNHCKHIHGFQEFGQCLNVTESSLYLAPHFTYPEPRMLTFLKANVCFWFLDDYLNHNLDYKATIVEEERYKEVKILADIVANILRVKYPTVEDIPKIKGLDDFFGLLFQVTEELSLLVTDYEKNCFHLAKSWRNFIFRVLGFTDGTGSSWQCEHTVMYVRRHNGFYPLVEVLALLDNVKLPPDVRSNFLVDTLYNVANDIVCLSTDVLGIQAELSMKKDLPGNLALWKVLGGSGAGKEMTLQTAVDYVQQLQQEHVFDFVKIKKTLLKSYSESEEIKRFIQTLEFITDGSIHLFLKGRKNGGERDDVKERRVELVVGDYNDIRPVKVVHLRP